MMIRSGNTGTMLNVGTRELAGWEDLAAEEGLFADPVWGDMVTLTPDEQDVYRQLHQLAGQIYARQQIVNNGLRQVANASGVVDWTALTRALNDVASLRADFVALRTRIDATNAAQLHALDSFAAYLGAWVQDLQDALADAAAFIPNTFLEALRRVTATAGNVLAVPVIAMGIGVLAVIALLSRAEKTRTFRKYVA